MADYRELLRRAIEALPENTGANRRAVYEKARGALVAQLRAIEPPLPAREITQHRLNLEDCIRQVEQEATDKLLGRFRAVEDEPVAASPVPVQEPEVPAAPEPEVMATPEPEPEVMATPEPEPEDLAPPEPEPEELAPPEPEPAAEPAPEPQELAAPEPDSVAAPDEMPEDAEVPEPDMMPVGEIAAAHAAVVAAEERSADEATSDRMPVEPDVDDAAGYASEPEVEPEAEHTPEPEYTPEPEVEPEPEYAPEPAVDPEPFPEPEYAFEPAADPEPAFEPEPVAAAPEAAIAPEVPPPSETIRPSTLANAPAAAVTPLIGAAATRPQPGSIEEIIAAAEAARMAEQPSGLIGFTNGHDAQPVAEAPPPFTTEAPSPEPEAFHPTDSGLDGDEGVAPAPYEPYEPQAPIAPEPEAKKGGARGLLASLPFGGGRKAPALIKGSAAAAAAAPAATLVDVHGQPLLSAKPAPVGEAMSSVREVDLEPPKPADADLSDPQNAIDRAIEALDREARGDIAPALPADKAPADIAAKAGPTRKAETRYSDDDSDERSGGMGALTVFLVLAVILMAGGGAAGLWAWREGYVDLDAVFAQGDPVDGDVIETAELEPAPETLAPPEVEESPADPAEAAGVAGEPMPGEQLPFVEPAPENPTPSTEERLPSEADAELPAVAGPGEGGAAAISPIDGPQSLLLEEQASGASGAVPYSGSVEWTRGSDELGNPTIEASASIPARNLDVDILLRRNSDDSLPASHLMEINFTVSETFVGGTVASLPGILLKNEELVQGQPLTGASARIVGNSFLFALSSASERDVETNQDLLESQGWLDVAMVYGTGRRAIMTLEKGEEGEQIFEDVLAAWAELDAAAPAEDAEAPETAEEAVEDAAAP